MTSAEENEKKWDIFIGLHLWYYSQRSVVIFIAYDISRVYSLTNNIWQKFAVKIFSFI